MALLETFGLGKDYGTRVLFSGLDLRLEPQVKTALIGRNGCGKTSLFRILAGIDTDHPGTVRRREGLRVGYVPQILPEADAEAGVIAFICENARRSRAELERVADSLSSCDSTESRPLLAEYAAVSERYASFGGDDAESRAERTLSELGLEHAADLRLGNLSGGERSLLLIAKAMAADPELLLLDEPGNHLDFRGLERLEAFLAGTRRAILFVSHDRRLVDRVAGDILDLSEGRLTRYSGNYSEYRLARLRATLNQAQDHRSDMKRIERLEALVRRFADIARSRPDPAWGKRLRAKRSQLERAKDGAVKAPDMEGARADMGFGGGSSKADIALRVASYDKSWGELRIVVNANFEIGTGDRVALVGPNGSGKTSIVRDIVELGSWENPGLRVGPSMRLGYCAQDRVLLDPESSVERVFDDIGSRRDGTIRFLKRYGFGPAIVDKTVGSLSGGELNRLQMALACGKGANFLILDEPTNHLDIPTREAVEEALLEFEGTILVVSHDRYFLSKIAERVLFLDGCSIREYEGNFDEFWRDTVSVDRSPSAEASRGAGKVQDEARRGESRTELETRITAMEREKERLEREIQACFEKGSLTEGKRIANELERHGRILERLWARMEAY